MRFIRQQRRRIHRRQQRFIFSAVAAGAQTISPDLIASAATVYSPTVTPGAVTISPNAIASSATVFSPTVSIGAVTIHPDVIASTATVYAPTVTPGAVTLHPSLIASGATIYAPAVLTSASIAGVLTVDPTNGRYFRNSGGILALAGFHTWYDVQDGGGSDPPSAFDWAEYLAALVSKGTNFTKLWIMETPEDWPDISPQYYKPHPWSRTGPGNAADGKLKFDLTTWDETYFTRLRSRAIEAGNAGIYVCVQLFQGWHIDLKGFSAGNPWTYHPFQNGNNINGIDGDTDNDGQGEETRATSFTAVYNLQKSYVAKVVDTLNDLDHVIWEVSNEETHSSTTLAWERALAAYIKSYEAGKPKQHAVGLTKLWPGGSNSDLFASDVEWTSIDDDYPTPVPDEADGSMVVLWDTDHVVGLTDEHKWIWQSFARGNNPIYMDEWDGALFGTDKRSASANERIRSNLGYVLDYAARIDLAHATPHTSLASTGYCLAKITGSAQFLIYQDISGNFTVTLTGITGTFSLEWLRVATGTIQADSNINGNGVRTLTPPWSSEDVVAFLEKLADLIEPNLISSTATVYSPTVTRGAVTISPNAISSGATVYAPVVTVGAVTISPNVIASIATVYAPVLTPGAVTISPNMIASGATVYSPVVSAGAVTISPNAIASAAQVFAPTLTPGAVTIAPDAIASAATVYVPIVTLGALTIYPDAIASGSTVYSPTVTPGAVTISPDAIASGSQVYAPIVTTGLMILPNVIASTAQVFVPTVTPGAVTISPDAIASGEVVYPPTVQPGAVMISPNAISSAAQVFVPVVTLGAATIYPDAIASVSQVFAPVVTPGAVTISPALIVSGAMVYAPTIGSGATQTISPNFIASVAQVFVAAILAISAERIYRVSAEPRTYAVENDDRTYTVTGD